MRMISPSLTVKPPVVIVVDDEPQQLKMTARILERDGYNVVACSSGEEALEQIGARDVDLVLLDNQMPGLSGLEVLAKTRSLKRFERLPVLMVTGDVEPEDQVVALDMGADDFVTKPFENKVLLARVRSLVRTKKLNDATEKFDNVLGSLCTAVEAKDPYTQGHSDRVSLIGASIAMAMDLDEAGVKLIQQAGLLHDIGKLVVDLSFINKPGKLTDAEWAVMKSHPEAGARIVAPLTSARKMLPLIRHHHERLNGRGYPDGLEGEEIPLPVRILSVADVYDALTTKRSYRDGMPHAKAMAILHREVEDGSWDARVVERLETIDLGQPRP